MQKYNDKANISGMKLIFMVAQMIVVSIVYSIGYTSFLAIQLSMKGHESTWFVYVPIIVLIILFPIFLHLYRQMFNKGRMLEASVWMMSMASLSIVLLYIYTDTVIG